MEGSQEVCKSEVLGEVGWELCMDSFTHSGLHREDGVVQVGYKTGRKRYD